MPPLSTTSRTDENRWIWRAFRYHSRTFSLAARLLPHTIRMPVATLYLFCRRVDTLADRRVLEIGAERALDEVKALRCCLKRTLAGYPPQDDALWRRLAEVHATYDLNPTSLYELIDGAVWDLEGRSIHGVDDLIEYANLVGGSVGAMMLPFLVSSAEQRRALDASARTLGIAMQITNILRDVGEDWRRLKRLYLPASWLERHALTPDVLLHPPRPGTYPALLERTMNLAEQHYRSGFEGIAALPRRVRPAIRAAARMYREIMNEVRARNYDNIKQRAYVPIGRKLRLIVHDDYERRKKRLMDAQAGVAFPDTGG